MPRTAGSSGAVSTRADHASHKLPEPLYAWSHDDSRALSSAVEISLTLADSTASVTLENRSGHAFPTGFPGRMALVRLVGTGAGGEVVWQSVQTDPMKRRSLSHLPPRPGVAPGREAPGRYTAMCQRLSRSRVRTSRPR